MPDNVNDTSLLYGVVNSIYDSFATFDNNLRPVELYLDKGEGVAVFRGWEVYHGQEDISTNFKNFQSNSPAFNGLHCIDTDNSFICNRILDLQVSNTVTCSN